jgi:ribonuclease HI
LVVVTLENESASQRSYLLNADGSGTGKVENPSEGAIGIVLRNPDGEIIDTISKPIGPATNTIAEYRAFIEGLRLAHSHDVKRIRVFLDSELVVDQINGLARVTKDHLRSLHQEATELFEQFPNRRVSWVPRKWNKEANALATAARPKK